MDLFSITLALLPSVFLGFLLGANDSANVLGPVIGSGIFAAKHLTMLSAASCFVGALVLGKSSVLVNSQLSHVGTSESALLYLVVSAIALLYLLRGIPVAITQIIVGVSAGVGIVNRNLEVRMLFFVVLGWFLTPLVSVLAGLTMYRLVASLFNSIKSIYLKALLLKFSLQLFTIYSAFSLGANSVGKFTGALYSAGFRMEWLLILGAFALTLGMLTFGQKIAQTVARAIVPLDDFSAFVCLASSSVVIYLFSLIGLPISPSHAVVSSIVGIGYARGVSLRDERIVKMIVLSWVVGPAVGALISGLVFSIVKFLW